MKKLSWYDKNANLREVTLVENEDIHYVYDPKQDAWTGMDKQPVRCCSEPVRPMDIVVIQCPVYKLLSLPGRDIPPCTIYTNGGGKDTKSVTVVREEGSITYYMENNKFTVREEAVRNRFRPSPWLLCVIGPSGSGKDTLVNTLQEPQEGPFTRLESWTSRPQRSTDDFHMFTTREHMEEMIASGEMPVWTDFDGNLYGVTSFQLSWGHVYVVDPDGFRRLKDYIQETGAVEKLLCVYLDIPPRTCMERMRKRGDKEEDVQRRAAHDKLVFKDFMDTVDVPCLRIGLGSALYKPQDIKTEVVDFLVEQGVEL